MRRKTKKILYWTLAVILLLLTVLFFLIGNYMVGFALNPGDRRCDYDRMGDKWDGRVPGIYAWYNGLHDAGVFRDTTLVNDRGFLQHAVYASAANPSDAQGTAVMVHGYTDNIISMMPIVRMYRDSLNFNVLVYDQEYHGQSEGEAIRMGWLDRFNAAMWTEAADNIWHEDFMVVHGVSMGAATVMMLSGDPDPEWVDAYVEDCGYTSVWDQFAKQLEDEFGLPPFPILNCASLICRIKYGWSFRQASSISQLAKSTKPVLFIHGDSDTYVPTADVYKNYNAKTHGLRKLWLSKNAAHARAYDANPAEYTAQVRAFINEVKGL